MALNKTISGSSGAQAGNPEENMLDGDTADSSRWSSEGFPQWAEIDLGQVYTLSQSDFYGYKNRAYQYTIEVSTDGTNYSTVVDRSSNTTGGNVISDSFSTTSGRYVKVTVTGASGYSGNWVSIAELMIFGN